MLELITNLSIKDKKQLLREFDPNKSLWVTSDIKSQFFILNQLEKSHQLKNKSCIVRARDYWSQLFPISYPEYHIVPRFFLILLYQKWAKNRIQEWQKRKETGALICQYMEALAHLLKHPLKNTLMEEWKIIETDKTTGLYWIKWYDLAEDFWNYLNEKKIIESSWASAFLLDNIPHKNIQFKEIIFDLGFDINTVEKELIYQISEKTSVRILTPAYSDNNEIHPIYKYFNQKNIFRQTKEHTCFSANVTNIKKFTTSLAEVKDITSWVTTALNKGIKPNRISVLAPRIEDYWSCLKSYFKRENIPVNKKETISLQSFPQIQLWFAKMQTHLNIISYENMDTLCADKKPAVNFSKLKADFYHVKQVEKWPVETHIKHKLKNKKEPVSNEKFIKWARGLLKPKENNDDPINKAIKECVNDFLKITKTVTGLQLQWQTWLNLLEFIIEKKEVAIHEGNPNGINCLSFNALGWVESDFTYITNLSEESMKTNKHNVISSLSAYSIMENLGFFIKSEPADKMEQIISGFIHQKHKELVLSFSSTNFSGTPLTPSRLWLAKAIEHKKDINHFDIPGTTLWDRQQRKSSVKEILSHRKMEHTPWELMEASIKEDLNHKVSEVFCQKEIKNLSPSSLDDYVKCPFIFSAKILFYLWDGPDRDMDIPLSERGSMVHKLFEILKTKYNTTSPSEKDILQIIEEIKTSKKFKQQIQKIHPVIWEKEKSWLLKRALIFLEQEERKKSLFKDHQTIGCEKTYHCYWNLKTQSPAKEGNIFFKGKIDRIDSDNQSYQIIDYKNSLPSGSVAPSWSVQDNFQMAIYMQVMELGLTDFPPLPVQSAFYLNYKNFDYQGLAPKTSTYIQLLKGSQKKSLISEETKKNILHNVNKKINSFILNIQEGYFPAQPKTKVSCVKCRWRKICRASHLN